MARLFWKKFETYRQNGLQPLEEWDLAQALASFVVGIMPELEQALNDRIARCKSGKETKVHHDCSKKCWITKGLCVCVCELLTLSNLL